MSMKKGTSTLALEGIQKALETAAEKIPEVPTVQEVQAVVTHAINYTSYLGKYASSDIRILTGAMKVHCTVIALVERVSRLYIYEGPSLYGGTEIAVQCIDRNTAQSTQARFYHTPYILSLAKSTVLSNGMIVLTDDAAKLYYILKTSTEYLFRLSNTSQNSMYASLSISFYEE